MMAFQSQPFSDSNEKKRTETAPFERKPTTPTLTVSTNLVRTPISRKLHMPRHFFHQTTQLGNPWIHSKSIHVLPSHGFFARISYEVITSFASVLGFLNRMKTLAIPKATEVNTASQCKMEGSLDRNCSKPSGS